MPPTVWRVAGFTACTLLAFVLVGVGVVAYLRSGRSDDEENLYTGWYGYRLSDMTTVQAMRDKIGNRVYHHMLYPDSLASAYLRRTSRCGKYDTLLHLVAKLYNKVPPPSPDTVVVHVRVGDLHDSPGYAHLQDALWDAKPSHDRAQSIGFYAAGLQEARRLGAKRAVIVGGAHLYYKDYPRSLAFLQAVEDLVRKEGLALEGRRYGGNPDEDVAYMARAAYILGAKRGFAGMVGRLVELQGGQVVRVPHTAS